MNYCQHVLQRTDVIDAPPPLSLIVPFHACETQKTGATDAPPPHYMIPCMYAWLQCTKHLRAHPKNAEKTEICRKKYRYLTKKHNKNRRPTKNTIFEKGQLDEHKTQSLLRVYTTYLIDITTRSGTSPKQRTSRHNTTLTSMKYHFIDSMRSRPTGSMLENTYSQTE